MAIDLSTTEVTRLANALQSMIFMMKSADNRCATLSENTTMREVYVISFIGDRDKVIMKDIADHINVPMSTATGIIDKMVKKDLVKRLYCDDDRRSIKLKLTDNGQNVNSLLHNLRHQTIQNITNALTDDEVQVFTSLLEKVTAGFKPCE